MWKLIKVSITCIIIGIPIIKTADPIWKDFNKSEPKNKHTDTSENGNGFSSVLDHLSHVSHWAAFMGPRVELISVNLYWNNT